MPGLRLSSCFARIETPSYVVFRSDLSTVKLSGEDARFVTSRLLPLLDGTRDRPQIAAALGEYSGASVGRLLDGLTRAGIVNESEEPERPEDAFFRMWGVAPETASASVDSASVLLCVPGALGLALAHELKSARVGSVCLLSEEQSISDALRETRFRGNTGPRRVLVETSTLKAPLILEVARTAHEERMPSLWLHRGPGRALLGPLVVPGKTACRVCASQQALSALRFDPSDSASPEAAPLDMDFYASLLAAETLKVLTGYTNESLGGRVVEHSLVDFRSSRHTLVRLPWCQVCGLP